MIQGINEYKASDLYNKLILKRTHYLTRAHEVSTLTIPHIYPNATDGDDDREDLDYDNPYQSLGARGVNNLANKIVLALFPPSTAFFKMGINPLVAKELNVGEGKIDSALYALEKSIVSEMETSQLRPVLVDLFKQGIIGGSAILHIPEKGEPRVINMKDFGIKRSKSGTILQLCIKEPIYYVELEKEIQEQLGELEEDEKTGKKPLSLYTMVIRKDSETLEVVQEIKGVKLKGTEGTYKNTNLPYIFIPFVDRGENYGRSYLEDYTGDLLSYEGLRKAILQASAEAARIIYLLKPNATLTINKLQKAQSGDVLLGSPDDVGTLQADKRLEVSMAQAEAEVLRLDLSAIFLLDSAVRRNAERVTAEEIRKVSQELEVGLGGIYSTIANKVQKALVTLYMLRLKAKGLLTDELVNSLDLEITTGSAALGRGVEFTSITTFAQALSNVLGPEFQQYLKVPEFISRVASSLDIGTASLIKSEQELEQERQLKQQMELQQQVAAPMVNAAAKQQG